jgi:hypothetical protein
MNTLWEKNDRAMYGNQRVRIESGPWLAGRPDEPAHTRYLVQVEDGLGRYRYAQADLLRPLRPGVGDRVQRLALGRRTDLSYTVYSMDAQVVVLERADSTAPSGHRWRPVDRAVFDRDWVLAQPEEE